MRSITSKQVYIMIAGIFIVFSILVSASTWQTRTVKPWTLNTDHVQFGNIISKNLNPDLFTRDFVFSSERYTDFYTPAFIQLMTSLTLLIGDYVSALAFTQLPLMLVYFFCAFLVYYQFTKIYTIAVIFTLLSIIGLAALNSEWEVSGLQWMLPRTYALPLLLLSFYIFLKIYDIPQEPKRAHRLWIFLGFAIGMTANFHPTTGMTLSIAMGSIVLAQTLKTGSPGWQRLVILIVSVILGAFPTIVHVLGNSNIGYSGNTVQLTTQEFRAFADIFDYRIRSYPFTIDFGRGWTAESEPLQLLIRVPWITLTLVSWFLARVNQRSRSALFFIAIQIVYVWLLVDNLDRMALMMIVVYTLYRWWHKNDSRLLLLYELIAGIILVAMALPVIVRPLWLHFELWSLTTFLVEFARGAKQLHIPITLILASLAVDGWHRWQTLDNERLWMRIMFVVSLITGLRMLIIVGLTNIIYDRIHDTLPTHYRRYSRVLIVVGFSVFFIVYTYIAVVRDSIERLYNNKMLLYQPQHYTVLVGVLIGVLIWLIIRNKIDETRHSQMIGLTLGVLMASIMQMTLITSQGYERESRAIIEIAEWVKEETPIDALFSIHNKLQGVTGDTDRNLFRLFSQRSLHFSFKDLNLIGYSQPQELVSQFERYEELNSVPLETRADFASYFESENVDYLIIERSKYTNLQDDIPSILDVGGYSVYECAVVCN